MKVITNCGGQWNRKAGHHIFDSDPRAKLGMALETGVAIDDKQKWQSFYTPSELADEVVQLANVRGQLVLEPSAGEGALADSCMKAGALAVQCIEMNPESAAKLEAKGYTNTCADFLTQAPAPYTRIVMNPPFTRGTDLKHVAHALKWLAPGGRLVAIMAGSDGSRLERTLAGCDWEVQDVPAGTFKESGTNIRTMILIADKHRSFE
jgi:hypothetical protein